jgi:basic amino acid/polyamine antiporter, APA family
MRPGNSVARHSIEVAMAQLASRIVVPPPASPARGSLLRVLGVGFGLAVTIGDTIGAGILRTPGDVATSLPNAWLFISVWVLGGVYAFLCALSVAELATMIPRSGGHYVFAREGLGDFAGFLIGWSDWLSIAGSNALIAIVVGEYAGLLFPIVAGHNIAVACGVVTFFTLLQWRGIRWGAGVQNVSSAIKALLFVLLAFFCFVLSHPVVSAAAPPPLPHGIPLLAAFVLAMQAVVYNYDGWQGVIYFGEEIRNPERNVSRSMFGGVLLITGIYVSLNLAILHVLPMSQLVGNKLALGAAAAAIWGDHADTIIQVVTIVSLLAAVNAIQLQGCRVMYAMSEDGLFVSAGKRVNPGGTPDFGLLVSLLAEIVFIVSGTLNQVLAALALFFVTNYIVDLVTVFILRRRQPDRPRPYRTWGYPWTTAIALAGSCAFIVGVFAGDTRNSIRSLIILAASYPLFRLVKYFTRQQANSRGSD